MSERCAKCGTLSGNGGALYVHVTPPVFLCGFCHNTFQSLHDKLFNRFMEDDCQNKPPIENWLSEETGNMLQARMERKARKRSWNFTPISEGIDPPKNIPEVNWIDIPKDEYDKLFK